MRIKKKRLSIICSYRLKEIVAALKKCNENTAITKEKLLIVDDGINTEIKEKKLYQCKNVGCEAGIIDDCH